MKRFLIILLALIVGGTGGYFAYKHFSKSGSLFKREVTAENYNEPFMWGVTMRPSALGRYNGGTWEKEIQVANDLGTKWVRVTWSYDAPDQFAFNDDGIQRLRKNNQNVYLVIEPSDIFENIQDPYQDGYDNAFKIVNHYKGQIKYYQIMNEAGSNALKGAEYSGAEKSDYEETKYQRTRDWIKGALKGVAEADSSAYRVVTSQWLQTGFLEKLEDDQVDYDIIGWDWFSDMGLMGEKKLPDGTLLIDELKSFDKPIILAEVNQRPDGKNGQRGQNETKQADFIQTMADWARNNDLKGFYILELLDVPNSGKGYTDYYGLVEADRTSSGTYVPGKAREAYSVYQEIIKKYSGN